MYFFIKIREKTNRCHPLIYNLNNGGFYSYEECKETEFKSILDRASKNIKDNRYIVFLPHKDNNTTINKVAINNIINKFETEYSKTIGPKLNIIIINELSSSIYNTDELIYMPLSNYVNLFKKVVNISLVFYRNQNFVDRNNIEISNLKEQFITNRKCIFGKGIYYHRFFPIGEELTSTNLEREWWFKWIIGVPRCASGRLVQFSGTCWFNAPFNALILNTKIKEDLLKLFDSTTNFSCYIKQLQFSSLNTDITVESKLWLIIYKIFIENSKLTSNVGNVSRQIANSLINECPFPISRINVATSNSIFVEDSMKILYNKLFKIIPEPCRTIILFDLNNYVEENLYTTLYCDFKKILNDVDTELKDINFNDDHKKLYKKYINTLNEKKPFTKSSISFMEEFDLIIHYVLPNKIDDKDITIVKDKYRISIQKLFDKLLEYFMSEFLKTQNNKYKHIILIPFAKYSVILPTILPATNPYNIESAVLNIKEIYDIDKNIKKQVGHVIAGLKCNNLGYIYDSNNKIIPRDWISELNKNTVYNQPSWIKYYMSQYYVGCSVGFYSK